MTVDIIRITRCERGERHVRARPHEYGQPVGRLARLTAVRAPARVTIEGRFCRVEPLDADRHADDLYAAFALAADGSDWTYMSVGPFDSLADYRAYVTATTQADDPLHYAIVDPRTGKPRAASP
ncbi:hypothetical protein ACU686_10875 [Yinghuangia aomiensis]